MRTVFFFKKKKPLYINNFFPKFETKKKIEFDQIKTLNKSNKGDLSFFDSIKYKEQAQNTKASFCITTQKPLLNGSLGQGPGPGPGPGPREMTFGEVIQHPKGKNLWGR